MMDDTYPFRIGRWVKAPVHPGTEKLIWIVVEVGSLKAKLVSGRSYGKIEAEVYMDVAIRDSEFEFLDDDWWKA